MKLKSILKTLQSQLLVVNERKNEPLTSEKEGPWRKIYAGYSDPRAVKNELDAYLEREVLTISANKDSSGTIFKNHRQAAYLSILLK